MCNTLLESIFMMAFHEVAIIMGAANHSFCTAKL